MATTNSNLNSLIEFVLKILLESLIYLSYTITFFALIFNKLLEHCYNIFIKKLNQHKKSIEENITNYIKKITVELTTLKPKLNRLDQNINNIQSQITNFDTNFRQIGHISGYNDLISIFKDPNLRGDISTIYQIFRTLSNYRNASNSFNRNKRRLPGIMKQLKFYSELISKVQIPDTEELRDYTAAAHRISGTLEGFKAYVDQFDEYVKNTDSLKKFQEITNHIKTLKLLINKVYDKIKPHLKGHIQSLVNIDFDYSQFHGLFTKIQRFTESFIKKFKIADDAIALHKSIESEITNFGGVQFSKYDIDELIKNSNEIGEKLKSFQTINLTSTTTTSDDLVSQIKETQQKYSSDILSYQSLINYLLYEISVLIYIHHLLQIIILYSIKISDIPDRIKVIDDLDKALSTLPEIFKDLTAFYRVNNSSMNILIVFNYVSLSRVYINKYIYNFVLINYYCEILIFSIYCYIKILSLLKFLQHVLEGISKLPELTSATNEIKILRAFTTNTNSYLKSILCNIESLNTLGDNLSIDNLKYNLVKIRTTIDKISEETNQVKNNIKFINKGILELIIINIKIIYIKKYIGEMIKGIISFIGYLYFYYIIIILFIEDRYIKLNQNTSVFLIHSNSIFNVIGNFKKLEKEISTNENVYKLLVENFMGLLVSVTNNINELTKIIETYIREIDKSVLKVECAIEGVPRNFIRCSLQSGIESARVNVISPTSHDIDSIYNNIKYIILKCVLFNYIKYVENRN